MGEMHIAVSREPVQAPIITTPEERLRKQVGELQRQLMEARDKLEQKGYVNDGLNMEQLEKENRKLRNRLEDLTNVIDQKDKALAEKEAIIQSLKAGADKRDDDRQKVIDGKEDMIKTMSEKITKLEQSVADRVRTIDRQKETNHRMAEQLEEARKQADEFKADLDKVLAENEELKKQPKAKPNDYDASNPWLAMEQALKILTTNLPDIKKRFAEAIDYQAVTQAHLSEMLRDLKFCQAPEKAEKPKEPPRRDGKPTPKAVRLEHGDKAKAVAEAIGVSPNHFWALENLKDPWPAERRQKFCERYKISEDDVAWGKIKLTGSGVHAKETLGV